MDKTEKKNKHMTLEDRIEIQECLQKGLSFKEIAMRIGKDPTTISKEVKHHAQNHSNAGALFCFIDRKPPPSVVREAGK